MIVLDTNVLSELLRAQPHAGVTSWLKRVPAIDAYTTTICEAEIFYGIALLPKGKRRAALEAGATALFEIDFVNRILAFDSAAARAFGEIAATRRQAGRPIGESDAQIAAIARTHGATVVTRDVQDFAGCGVTVASPWSI
jgi:predicted nucleic acid-binding protein